MISLAEFSRWEKILDEIAEEYEDRFDHDFGFDDFHTLRNGFKGVGEGDTIFFSSDDCNGKWSFDLYWEIERGKSSPDFASPGSVSILAIEVEEKLHGLIHRRDVYTRTSLRQLPLAKASGKAARNIFDSTIRILSSFAARHGAQRST